MHLAKAGYAVTALDFAPAALAAARARAEQAGVAVEYHDCNVVDFEAPTAFDVVLDSGCLHHLPKSDVAGYRRRLNQWLAPGGDYVLVHFAHRPRVGWIPQGPRHLTREQAVARFAPLGLRAYDETSFDVPLPTGRMRAGVYWFSRPAG